MHQPTSVMISVVVLLLILTRASAATIAVVGLLLVWPTLTARRAAHS